MSEIDSTLFKEIVEQGLREFPNECCGVIAADADGRPVRVFPARNIDASPVTYRLDAKDQLRISDEIDELDLTTWGFYHSHTHSEAYPSKTDRKQAYFPETRYLILSLADRDRPVLRAFFLPDGPSEDGTVTEEELTIA
jgi:[CysO sulfur-carrier protein]-S-L-cysteine hydrolase